MTAPTIYAYDYEVISINNDNKTMEVDYKREGKEPRRLAIPLPKLDVNVAEHINTYSPAREWFVADSEYAAVEVGFSGSNTIAQ